MNNFDELTSTDIAIYPIGYSKMELIQIRDNLLLALLTQLSFNRALLQENQFSAAMDVYVKVEECKIQEKKQELTDCCPTSMKRLGKFHRRIANRNSANQNTKGAFSAKNDTKNIPKNYGKAILSYILKSPKTRKLTSKLDINLPDFLIYIRKMKGKINSIDGLKKMWGSENLENKIKKCIRILSYLFMRQHCLRYIFHSKVRNYGTHIKYRQKIIEGIENPQKFNHIKEY